MQGQELTKYFIFVTGKGIPEEIMNANNQTYTLPSEGVVPTKEQAVVMYENEGGKITEPEMFGVDPLHGNLQLQQERFNAFTAVYNSFNTIFHTLVNGDSGLFKESLQYSITLSSNMNKQ